MNRLRLSLLSLALTFSLAGCVEPDGSEVSTTAAALASTDCLGQQYVGAQLPQMVVWNGTLPQGVLDRHVWLLFPTDASQTMYEVWLTDPEKGTIPWAAKFPKAQIGPVMAKILGGAGQADVVRTPPVGPGPRGTEFAIFLLEYARRLPVALESATAISGVAP